MRSIFNALLFLYVLFPGYIFAQNGGSNNVPQYLVDLKLFPELHTLKAEVSIEIDSSLIEKGLLELFLNPHADIEYVTSEPPTEINIEQLDENTSKIIVDVGDTKITELALSIAYRLKIPEDHPVNRITMEWIELNVDSFWLPQISSFPRFQYQMKLNMDGTYELMTGDIIEEADGKGNFVINNRLPRVDISFSAAKKLYTTEGNFVEISALHADTKIDSIKLLADRAMTFLSGYIDEPEDFKEKRKVIVSPRKDVGYSRKNYIVLSDVRNRNDVALSGFLCHEFAHYWFSEANSSTRHHWLSESFAEYLSMIFIREQYGPEVFEKLMEEKQERIENDKKVLADYEGRPSYLAMYVKGPLILQQFEQYIGNENFQLFINSFVDRKIRTNEELFELIETMFGSDALVKLKGLRERI